MTTQKHRLLLIGARDRRAPDKLTLTIHGPKTEDRRRLANVLTRLMDSDAEWDSLRPNADLIVTMDAEATPLTQDQADFVEVITALNPAMGQYVLECIVAHPDGDLRAFSAAFETAANTARGWCTGRFG